MSNTVKHVVPVPLCHPSIRIAGTENDYIPTFCSDSQCSSGSVSHLHCPFCNKTDIYHDARILKAHYRVKHVDKGIQFAGLKILRCCEQCDIVGAIKGEKKFKGAHWHCYKCKNGFNRRDEAVKHYKTHFRHPYTTFQIHLSQEVHSSADCQYRTVGDADSNGPFSISCGNRAAVTSVVLQNSEQTSSNDNSQEEQSSDVPDSVGDGTVQIAQPTEGQTAIMIIQGDPIEGAADNVNCNEIQQNYHKDPSEKVIADLKVEIQRLKEEKRNLESSLATEIEQLKTTISRQDKELEALRKRERELVRQLTAPKDDKVQQLIASLRDQHEQLLHEHLKQLGKEVFDTLENAENGAVQSSPTSTAAENQVVEIMLQENDSNTSGFLTQNLPASYTICMSEEEPKSDELQVSSQTNLTVTPDASKSSELNAEVLLINQNACDSFSAENFVMPATEPNFNETNIAFVTDDQLQNCIGTTATLFDQNSSSPYFVINHKGETQLIGGGKRKLYIAEYPAEKKITKCT